MAAEIVEIGSWKAAMTVTGIVYMIILLAVYFGSPKGFARFGIYMSIVSLGLIGMCWVGVNSPDLTQGPIDDGSDGYYPYVQYKGEWRNEQDLYQSREWGPAAVDLYWDSPRIFKMHAVGGISPRFYHPDQLWWCPIIALAIITCLNPSYILLWIGLFFAGNALGNND